MVEVDKTIQQLEEELTARILDESRLALERSSFFSGLKRGELSVDTLQYVFGQYRFWRDQFHTWFGLCILKSGSCEDADVASTVGELAEHTLVEMRDDHGRMYREFLHDLGLDEETIRATGKSDATDRYERSFLEAFGVESDNFFEAVLALSGRELFASLRNTFVAQALAEQYGYRKSKWWTLHEELEEEHFRSVLHPYLQRVRSQGDVDRIIRLTREEIDRHVQYWDALVNESRHLAA